VIDLPGWETRLYLIEYGPGAVAPLHVHPAVGVGLVLDGTFESAFGDDQAVQVHAGQGFVDPAGVPHRVFRNFGSDHGLRFVIAYTIRTGEEIFYPGASLAARAIVLQDELMMLPSVHATQPSNDLALHPGDGGTIEAGTG
jgi:mannose-6-phosphate isomerase-like protein (cupin superfamily)